MLSKGLYDSKYEHDACGVGFIADTNGRRSHDIVMRGVEILDNLMHRGATGADESTGDGAGLLIQLPDTFLRRECVEQGIVLPEAGSYGVGMVFLPRDDSLRARCKSIVESVVEDEDLDFLGWRDVPTDGSVLGQSAREDQPVIEQFFVSGISPDNDRLEQKLYVVRKQIEAGVAELTEDREAFYIASLSSRTIVYKGLMLAPQVTGFYPDLKDPEFDSAVAVVHQRYSTNTFPSWSLAQPFRFLAHNGEINTLRGNRNWMACREQNLKSETLGDDISKVVPVIEEDGSDSASLDNALELLTMAGRSLWHSIVMLIPQAWGQKYPMGPDLRGFFEYHAGLMEPWDGPASVAFTDGRFVGALLDRNGLRPARYTVLNDGLVVCASEAGVLEFKPEEVHSKGALRPGEIMLIDMQEGRILYDKEIKMRLARQQPYRRWVEENKIEVRGFYSDIPSVQTDRDTLVQRQKLFGYSREDITRIIDVMASEAHEPVGSMGSDQPLAVLSEKPQLLYWYFKQSFAQVTNPPIDPIREELVMSLMTFMGNTDQILTEVPGHAKLIKLQHPILSNEDLLRIRSLRLDKFGVATIKMGFNAREWGPQLEAALSRMCRSAEAAIEEGKRVIVLSDRDLSSSEAPVPALLAVAAVNRRLVERRLRTSVSLVVETGEAREVMHLALLLGYGASAVNPYLAFETVAEMVATGRLSANIGEARALKNYVSAMCKGLLKIMSKMGISTLRSYRNAQIFQAVGLNSELVDRFFTGTPTQVEGIGLDEIAAEARARHEAAHASSTAKNDLLEVGGQYHFARDGERHLWTPDTIHLLQWATRSGDEKLYRQYAKLINDQSRHQCTLRGLFKFKKTGDAVPIEEVEPASSIAKRFVTGAMSFGSISREAHETLAIAMNRIGGMSNSGEGGEDPDRYNLLPNGDSRSSAIKQIASGRFGVTSEYLVHAKDLQIKIAQGAKPGEGGQLPGHKVNEEIARVRHSTPGVSLISPPPHHDIYSIEDIKQLIFDLKNANPEARVSVKLVSEAGVGTVAAGVAKGRADMILISGYDGGTGASPLTSIKHAGMPWEVGLAETQQTLLLNKLRSRVRLQADGQLKTGRDVAIAMLLGAEEFGFATTALVVCGCVMMRKCHKNTCPVGVATQDPELRKLFTGKPEHVENFMLFIAEEVREIMAELGLRTVDEAVGRADLLEVDEAIDFWKARGLDLSDVLYCPEADDNERRCTEEQSHELEDTIDARFMQRVTAALDAGESIAVDMPLRNVHRTVGTMISSEIARRYGMDGLPDETVRLNFTGAAGQSFGAFCSKGMKLVLEGEANDYVAKGLSGARVVVKPPRKAKFDPAGNIIAGNVILYGATSGEVFINGCAGERFAIRNSGATAVVEGVGDHACEYMTGGRVVVLGATGVNFAAGMSGGIAYVLDETGMFDANCNLEMVDLELVVNEEDQAELHAMIEAHCKETGSARAAEILEHWQDYLPKFVKVFPMEYRRALGLMSLEDEAIERREKLFM